MFRKRNQSGFTLVELLVVVAIISTIMSIVTALVGDARARARDTKRRTDLNQIQVALELYRNQFGTFQVAGGGFMGGGQGWLSYENGSSYPTSVTRVLYNQGFLPQPIIEDPLQTPGYMIYVCNGGQSYALSATLEAPTPRDIADIQASCNGTGANGTYTSYGKNVARTNQ
jgi:prepilin-type N-terminal cleavage/methylation domain-containing protein